MSILAEVMRKDVKSVKHTSPISEAAQLMKQDKVSALFVKQNNDSMTVESIMTAPFITIESHQSPSKAQEMVSEEGVRHLVVREGKTITGGYRFAIFSCSIKVVPKRNIPNPKLESIKPTWLIFKVISNRT